MIDPKTLACIGPIWTKLAGGLWHTTSLDRFTSILRSGGLDPEPAFVPEAERWGSLGGSDTYPLVRHLGGVSLFDFSDFKIDIYTSKYIASWSEFLPFRRSWGSSVWIGVDRNLVRESLLSAEDLLPIWKQSDQHLRRNWMPGIEAGHLGRIPVAAFTEAWIVSRDDHRQLPLG